MIYEPEFADQARTMCRLGATDEELAEHFEVCVRTIYRWRNTHEEFAEAVIVGKEHADARVERALYSRAVGCAVERTRVFKSASDPDPVYATYQHHLPPDPNAALQWLRVRQPKKWRIAEEVVEDNSFIERFRKGMERVAAGREADERAAAAKAATAPPQQPEQPSSPPPPEAPDAEPDHDLDLRPDDEPAPDPGSCLDGAPDPDADPGTCPDDDDYLPPAPAEPPNAIPPGFPLERVRFGYG